MRAQQIRRATPLAAALFVMTACAPAGPQAESRGAAASGPDGVPASDAAAADQPTDAADGRPLQDTGGVDWATVDLTTIDWATIDMRAVDWRAATDNPTAANLDQATRDLIVSRTDPGSATLTIGDQTWEFDSFDCAFGHENTESDTFSFTTNAFGEFDGVRVQMQVTIADESGQARVEGSGVVQRITLDDISDFENPSVGWYMRATDAVSIDGYEVNADGVFDDQLTDLETEEIPGTLQATCSTHSRY